MASCEPFYLKFIKFFEICESQSDEKRKPRNKILNRFPVRFEWLSLPMGSTVQTCKAQSLSSQHVPRSWGWGWGDVVSISLQLETIIAECIQGHVRLHNTCVFFPIGGHTHNTNRQLLVHTFLPYIGATKFTPNRITPCQATL